MATFTDILEWSRGVNINALRWLSLSLILISTTPLASLWYLFCSWAIPIGLDREQATTAATAATSTRVIQTLQNPNATLQEILTAMLQEHHHGVTNRLAYHWAAVIPWALSLLFGFFIPIILYIFSLIRSRRLQQERLANYSQYKRKKRRKKIGALLARTSKTLQPQDRDVLSGTGTWKLPPPGTLLEESPNSTRTVNGECAICLSKYDYGHQVVWSQVKSCCHAFHSDCLADWFSLRKRKHHLCPCCRQEFVINT